MNKKDAQDQTWQALFDAAFGDVSETRPADPKQLPENLSSILMLVEDSDDRNKIIQLFSKYGITFHSDDEQLAPPSPKV